MRLLLSILIWGSCGQVHAQSTTAAPMVGAVPEVEWYPPETEKGPTADKSRVVISGRTLSGSLIQIDGDSVTILNEKLVQTPSTESAGAVTVRQLRISCKVYEAADVGSKTIGTLKKGAKIRAVPSNGSWLKVFSTKSSGYISQPCFVPTKDEPVDPRPGSRKIESRTARANQDGFFEIVTELPQGLAQIPISVTTPARAQKTFMISVNVVINENKVDDIKINTNTKISQAKPPAAAKKVRLWFGAGFTYQSDSQTTTGSPDLNFSTVQAPGLVARGGYWGDKLGVDFYFRDAPGKIEADAPLQVQETSYHWQTMEAKGLYQFDRGPGSRIGGLPSQWQLRFGANLQQVPFFDIDNSNVVTIQENTLTMATLGGGLLLGQEQDWSWEFALGIQYPISAKGQGKSFTISSPFAYEAQIGAAYKLAPNWRLGVFSYTQSLAYDYEFENDTGTIKTGKQNLFYTTFDLRLGYEF